MAYVNNPRAWAWIANLDESGGEYWSRSDAWVESVGSVLCSSEVQAGPVGRA